MRDGHWSLFAGPAHSLSVAVYGIDGSQGELSGLLVRSVLVSTKSNILNSM